MGVWSEAWLYRERIRGSIDLPRCLLMITIHAQIPDDIVAQAKYAVIGGTCLSQSLDPAPLDPWDQGELDLLMEDFFFEKSFKIRASVEN